MRSFLVICLVLWFFNDSPGDGGSDYRMWSVLNQLTVSTPIGNEIPLEFARLFSNTIAGGFDMDMQLTRSGNKLQGYILGPGIGPGGSWVEARIQGSIDKAGNVIAEVSTAKPIGTLRGKLTVEVGPDRITLSLRGELKGPAHSQTVSMESTDLIVPGKGLSIVPALIYRESLRGNYVEVIYYPQLQPANESSARQFNRKISSRWGNESSPDTRWEEDPTELENTLEDSKEPPAAILTSFFNVGWELGIVRADFISIQFRTTSHGYGAAHPVSGYFTVNYDLSIARMVDLADLFLPDSDYVKVISDYCVAELIALKRSDDEWVKKGAGPVEKNFRAWLVVPEGLRVLFSEYQVASYAAGTQDVVVPVSVFKHLLKPERRGLFQP
ncbi:MAG: RsiV family protein [Pseudomonadota bacterium]